jgi:hypothetical protein
MAFDPALPFRVSRLALLTLSAWVLASVPCPLSAGVDNKPQIEYISPDGKFAALSATEPNVRAATAAFVDRNTVSCALKEGETTFIIELPANASTDPLTFLNENAAASGELRIAVSDSALPVDSPKWTPVDGIVPFAHKRLFKLSMLGVETKFVRLSFKVDGQENNSAGISQPFRGSILAQNINSTLARFNGIRRELNLATISVGPLSAPKRR